MAKKLPKGHNIGGSAKQKRRQEKKLERKQEREQESNQEQNENSKQKLLNLLFYQNMNVNQDQFSL